MAGNSNNFLAPDSVGQEFRGVPIGQFLGFIQCWLGSCMWLHFAESLAGAARSKVPALAGLVIVLAAGRGVWFSSAWPLQQHCLGLFLWWLGIKKVEKWQLQDVLGLRPRS